MNAVFQRRALAVAACALISITFGQAWAQAKPPEDADPLNEVTITARALQSGTQPVQQLSGAALTERQGSTLGETLDHLPGIANSAFGPNVGRPVIRGMEGDRVRLLQNSGANMDVSGLSNDHALAIDPLTIERIEVLRGPSTLLYGGSGIGGVVNVIDNRIARERTFDDQGGVMGKAEVRVGGAADERSTAAMVEAGNDQLALHVDAFDRSTQNLRVPKEMTCGLGGAPNDRRVCNSASNSRGGAVGGTLLLDRGYLGLSTSEFRNTYGTVAEPTVRIGMLRQHHVMEGQLREVGAFEAVKFQWGYTRYSHTEFETPQATTGTRFDHNGHDFRLEARQRPMTLSSAYELTGVVGVLSERSDVQARNETGTVALIPPSRTESMGVFGYQVLKTSWGELSAAARIDNVEVQSFEPSGPAGAIPAQSLKFQPVNVALGALRQLRVGEAQTGWQLSTHVSANQRAPKDYELLAHGQHAATGTYEMGQPTNGIEKGTQWDVGGEWKQGPHQFALTGFVSEFSNYLSLQPLGTERFVSGMPDYQFEGVRARFYGFESNAKIRAVGGPEAWLSPAAANGNWDLELRADAVRAQDLTHNTPVPRIAPVRVGADTVWTHNGWSARWGFMHAAAQNRVPSNGDMPGITTAGYTLWHAGLDYHTHMGPTHWLWFAKLDNLTNKLAYSSTSVLTQTLRENAPPLAGRSLKVGAQVSF